MTLRTGLNDGPLLPTKRDYERYERITEERHAMYKALRHFIRDWESTSQDCSASYHVARAIVARIRGLPAPPREDKTFKPLGPNAPISAVKAAWKAVAPPRKAQP